MSDQRTTRPASILLLGLFVSAALLLGSRLSIDDGRIVWRPFGEPRHSFAHSACGIPIHVTLDAMDPRFGYDRATVQRAMRDAAALWQGPYREVMFVHSSHPRAMAVSLVFDDRQHSANQRRTLRSGIDRNRSRLESGEAELSRSGDRIEWAQSQAARERDALLSRARDHADRIAAWNAAPGSRNEAQRQQLEREGAEIRAAFAQLDRARRALNADIAAHNERVNQRRAQAEALQGSVEQYNAFASDHPIESGRYSHDREQGRRIAVFRAADYNELVWILAHEFGHALGLVHVQQPGAVMSALLHEDAGKQRSRAMPVVLGDADRLALARVCGGRLQPPQG